MEAMTNHELLQRMRDSFAMGRLFASRHNAQMPLRNAMSHMALINKIAKESISIEEKVEELIEFDGKAYSINLNALDNMGIEAYLRELGRGTIEKSGQFLTADSSDVRSEHGVLKSDHLYFFANNNMTTHLAAKAIHQQVRKEISVTVKALSQFRDMQSDARKMEDETMSHIERLARQNIEFEQAFLR